MLVLPGLRHPFAWCYSSTVCPVRIHIPNEKKKEERRMPPIIWKEVEFRSVFDVSLGRIRMEMSWIRMAFLRFFLIRWLCSKTSKNAQWRSFKWQWSMECFKSLYHQLFAQWIWMVCRFWEVSFDWLVLQKSDWTHPDLLNSERILSIFLAK